MKKIVIFLPIVTIALFLSACFDFSKELQDNNSNNNSNDGSKSDTNNGEASEGEGENEGEGETGDAETSADEGKCTAEVCDGLDNNCNGSNDENLPACKTSPDYAVGKECATDADCGEGLLCMNFLCALDLTGTGATCEEGYECCKFGTGGTCRLKNTACKDFPYPTPECDLTTHVCPNESDVVILGKENNVDKCYCIPACDTKVENKCYADAGIEDCNTDDAEN